MDSSLPRSRGGGVLGTGSGISPCPLGIQPAPGLHPPTHTLTTTPFAVAIPVTAAGAVTSFSASFLFLQGFPKLRKELEEQISLFHASYGWELQVFRDLKASFFISERLYLKLLRRCTCLPTSVSVGAARGSSVLPFAPTRSSCFISSLLRQTDHSCDREWGLQQPEVDYCT